MDLHPLCKKSVPFFNEERLVGEICTEVKVSCLNDMSN